MFPKVLVTGASGFTGQALLGFLEDEGAEIFAASRSVPNIGVHVPIDVSTSDHEMLRVVSDIRPDYLFHLAGVSSGEPADIYRVNVGYAASLLQALTRSGHPCVALLVGSAAEYGRVDTLPVSEDAPTQPYGHYGISKLAQTQLGLAFDAAPLRVVVARTFNLVGPHMPKHLAIGAFVTQLQQLPRAPAQRVLEVGTLDVTRDYVHVRDAARAYWALMRTPAAYGKIVNVCTGSGVSLRVIAETLCEIAGGRVELREDPRRIKPIDIPFHYGNNDLLAELTGIRLTLNLRSALADAFNAS